MTTYHVVAIWEAGTGPDTYDHRTEHLHIPAATPEAAELLALEWLADDPPTRADAWML